MGTKSLLARENLKSCKSSGTKASTKSIWWATKLLTLATTVISDFEYVFSQLKRIKIFTTQFLFSLQPDFNLRSSLTGEWFQISHFYSIDKRKCDLFRSNKYKKQVLSLPRKTQNSTLRMFHFWCHEHGLESNPWPSELTVRALVHSNLEVYSSPSINNFYRQHTTAISTKRIWPEKTGDVTAKLNPLFYCQLNGACSKQRLLRSLDELIWSQISTGKELVEAGTEPLTSWSLGNRADH